jgi:hypothetical protein
MVSYAIHQYTSETSIWSAREVKVKVEAKAVYCYIRQ